MLAVALVFGVFLGDVMIIVGSMAVTVTVAVTMIVAVAMVVAGTMTMTMTMAMVVAGSGSGSGSHGIRGGRGRRRGSRRSMLILAANFDV